MAHVIGIDIGGTKTAVCLVAAGPRILARTEFPTRPLQRPPEAVCAESVQAIAALYRTCGGERPEDAAAVGVSCGGPLDPWAGVIGPQGHPPPNLPGWSDFGLKALLQAAFPGLPVAIDNDASNLALGEAVFGGGRGLDRSGILLLGTGVGGGFVTGGRTLRGLTGNATEFGQQVFLIRHGPAWCPCTLRESVAAGDDPVRLRAALAADVANFLDPAAIVIGPPAAEAPIGAVRAAARPWILNPLFAMSRVSDPDGSLPAPPWASLLLGAESRFADEAGRTWRGDAGAVFVVVETEPDTAPEGWVSLEDLCSGKGIVARAKHLLRRRGEPDREPGTAAELFSAARGGDPLACRVFGDTARFAAVGLANIGFLMAPDAIFLCGGIAQCADAAQQADFLETVRTEFAARTEPGVSFRIEATRLGKSAGDLSAVAAWFDATGAIRTSPE